jgi:ABC-type sugar transport system substrate-binding protein
MSKILRRKRKIVVAYRDTRGTADSYQNKWVAGKAICKAMKTKGEQTVLLRSCAAVEGHPTPGVFAKEFGFA